MRRTAILAASGLAAAALAACNAGAQEGKDGNAEQARRSFQVGEFRSVSLTGSPDVIVTVGGAPSVRAEGDARLVERLEIRVEDGDLRIGFRESSSWNFGFTRHRHVTIHVTAPAIDAAALTGSGDMRIDRVEGERFAGAVTGSGDLEIGRLRAGDASFSLTGSGGIRAAGAARNASIHVAGSGDVDLGGLEIRSADVSLMGSGDVAITGPARCAIEKRGSGDVRCGDRG